MAKREEERRLRQYSTICRKRGVVRAGGYFFRPTRRGLLQITYAEYLYFLTEDYKNDL